MRDISSLNPSICKNKQIVVVGFGSQGRAQALNLKDSSFNVKVALKESSPSKNEAERLGFAVLSFEKAIQIADIIMLLTPDETHAEFFLNYIKPNFKKGGTIIVAHGFSFHFKLITDFTEYNVGMVAPKAIGKAVRNHFINKAGIFSLIAKFHQANDELEQILLEIAFGIGSKKILETTFQVECESDLFGEQVVLCGGTISLFKNAFDVMVEAGFPPLIAYYECIHELKLIVDLIYEKGVNSMFSSISNTAKFGGFKVGDFLVDDTVKQKMKVVLADIKNGSFANTFITEALEKKYKFKQDITNTYKNSELEKAGEEVINLLK
jgi:ketol-acid reductoisomerase